MEAEGGRGLHCHHCNNDHHDNALTGIYYKGGELLKDTYMLMDLKVEFSRYNTECPTS